jgi:dTDP-glucose pyrophosphorylase
MLKDRSILSDSTLLDALKKMDLIDRKLLIVLKDKKFFGLISAGDIQRAIIQNKPLSLNISEIMRKNILVASPEDSFESIKKLMFDFRMELCPVVNGNHEIVKVFFWEEVFINNDLQPNHKFDLPIVIMAGGIGSRLRPLTNILPKPLLPIGDRTIVEHIFSRFSKHGSNTFYLSVNYKSDLIRFYLENQKLPYDFSFFEEKKPLGTAGSLSLLKGRINSSFFVTNCDILIDQDYSEILDYHRMNENEITIVSALKHISIPYGTIETSIDGILVSLQEKPELTFKINSGMYLLEAHLLDEIPTDEFFHITHLIENVQKRQGKVGVFPVSEKSWRDIGQWDDFLKNKGND